MGQAAEASLGGKPRFVSVTAEATRLATASVDTVTAAQALHWFDPARVRTEFARILRPGSHTVVVWNDGRLESTAFPARLRGPSVG
jgi:ubiquinone/menaquinone biosynthesis C-methylase UbiE